VNTAKKTMVFSIIIIESLKHSHYSVYHGLMLLLEQSLSKFALIYPAVYLLTCDHSSIKSD